MSSAPYPKKQTRPENHSNQNEISESFRPSDTSGSRSRPSDTSGSRSRPSDTSGSRSRPSISDNNTTFPPRKRYGKNKVTKKGSCNDDIFFNSEKLRNNFYHVYRLNKTTVAFRCLRNFHHKSGDMVLTCLPNGSWSGQELFCEVDLYMDRITLSCSIITISVLVPLMLLGADFYFWKRRRDLARRIMFMPITDLKKQAPWERPPRLMFPEIVGRASRALSKQPTPTLDLRDSSVASCFSQLDPSIMEIPTNMALKLRRKHGMAGGTPASFHNAVRQTLLQMKRSQKQHGNSFSTGTTHTESQRKITHTESQRKITHTESHRKISNKEGEDKMN